MHCLGNSNVLLGGSKRRSVQYVSMLTGLQDTRTGVTAWHCQLCFTGLVATQAPMLKKAYTCCEENLLHQSIAVLQHAVGMAMTTAIAKALATADAFGAS